MPVTAKKQSSKTRTLHGKGKYKVMAGTHYDGERVCSCGERLRKHERPDHIKQGHNVEGEQIIYGVKLQDEEGNTIGYGDGVNGGNIVDSYYDLSVHNTKGAARKFAYLGPGKYTPASVEGDKFSKMSASELREYASENEIDVEDCEGKDDLLAAIRMAFHNG